MAAVAACPVGGRLMNVRVGVLRFVRGLSADPSERRRLGAAVVSLLRQRRRSLTVLGPLIRFFPTNGNAKLLLWRGLARSCANVRPNWSTAETSNLLATATRSTQAYVDAAVALSRDRNGFLQRGKGYGQLRRLLSERPPERLFVFHHYDPRGVMPHSWHEALLVLQSAGWQVLISSSYLDPDVSFLLESAGVQIVGRANIGLCLGAYRDLALLLHATPAVHQQLKALVFCNDSNLLVQPPAVLLAQLERWTKEHSTMRPVLAGLTDSVERCCYHLQSFLLHANRGLIKHPAWLRFWLEYAIDGSKDDLINKGEIGLSQTLLAAGVELKPAYPLVHGLLTDQAMASELQRYGRSQLEHVNQSLFAWRSLLARGFPLVKKHVLFKLAEHQAQQMAIADLARWIPQERCDLLARDIEQLMISRYSGGEPRMD